MQNKKIIEEFVNKGLKYLESAEAFAQQNIPAYIEEILTYKLYEEFLHVLWSLPFFFIFGVILYILFIRKDDEGKTFYNRDLYISDDFMSGLLMGMFTFLVGILVLLSQSLDIIQIYTAPRMYLVEYFQNL